MNPLNELIKLSQSTSEGRNMSKKRRQISLQEKLVILNEAENGQKIVEIAKKFGISSSTVGTILKDKFKIKLLSEHFKIDPHRKRMRLGLFKDVDEAVNIWFQQMKSKHVTVTGPMLQHKAREFALQLGHGSFEGSSGWLFRFRERYGISGKAIFEEDRNNHVSVIGMTDDEIVASVCPVPEVIYTEVGSIEDFQKHSQVYTETESQIDLKEAMTCVDRLKCFLSCYEDVPDQVFQSMNIVADYVVNDIAEKCKQKRITDFFKPERSYPADVSGIEKLPLLSIPTKHMKIEFSDFQ